jgi:hypothetical protein
MPFGTSKALPDYQQSSPVQEKREVSRQARSLPQNFSRQYVPRFSNTNIVRIILLEGANHTFGGREARPGRIEYNPAESLYVLGDLAARREWDEDITHVGTDATGNDGHVDVHCHLGSCQRC